MPLAAVVESLDAIPEGAREFYVESEGKYVLDADVEGHPKARGLKTALESERRDVRKYKAEFEKRKDVDLDRWGKLKDLTDEEVEAFNTWKLAQAEQANIKNGGDPDAEFLKRAEPLKKKYENELAAKDRQIQESQKAAQQAEEKLKRTTVTSKISDACSQEGIRREAMEEVVPFLAQFVNVNKDGEVVVLDENGEERFGSDGKLMKLREFIQEKGAQKPHWWHPSHGGGANNGTRGQFGNITSKSQLDTTEKKVKFISKHGREAFEKLPA